MKRPIIVLVLLAIAFVAWMSVFGAAPSYEEFRAIENKYKQPEELAPSTLENINGYKQEMFFLKKKYARSEETALLADIRIDLAQIEENLILAGNELAKMDRRNPDCSEGSRIAKSRTLLESANKRVAEVEDNSLKLESNYKNLADASGISSTSFKTSVSGISKSIDSIGNIINSYC